MIKDDFKLLVGLGNPGSTYTNTRHNVGFMALERLASKGSTSFKLHKKIFGQIAEIGIGETKKRLLMPTTFMNESGRCINAAMNWFNLQSNQILIVVDDIDLPVGKIRIRTQGSSGGHNGLKSIINTLGTDNFCRIKIGIGHPSAFSENRKSKTISHVLGSFNSNEKAIIEKILDEVIEGLYLIQNHGLAIGMNHLNGYKHDLDSQKE